MAKNVPTLQSETKPQVQKAYRAPMQINVTETMCKHTILQVTKIKDKEQRRRQRREKTLDLHRPKVTIIPDSSESEEVRRTGVK